MPASCIGPTVRRIARRLILRRQVRHDVHARRIQPDEERLAVRVRLVDERQRLVADLVVYRLHARRAQFTGILDLLLADLAPTRIHSRVIAGRRPRVQHVARAYLVAQILRIVRMARVFHRVEVVQVAVELIEPVHRRQELVAVAEVVLAELTGGVAHRFQHRRDRHRLRGYARSARRPVPRSSCRCESAIRR